MKVMLFQLQQNVSSIMKNVVPNITLRFNFLYIMVYMVTIIKILNYVTLFSSLYLIFNFNHKMNQF